MDYEQKYKRALERAREYLEAENFTEMADVFPELSESEDERIRKAIIKSIEEDSSVYEQEVSKEQMLAYLEKQKENPKSAGSFTDDIIEIRSFQRGIEEGRKLEKQKEQKPIQTSEEKEYIRTLKSLISDFIRDKQPEDVAFYQKMYDWLEGRHIEQKPVEWSEEDEEMLDIVLTMVDCSTVVPHSGGQLHPSESYKKDISEWLKSLRPSWKPSEEQMEALRKAVNKLADTEVADSVRLSIMYDHLKELM